MSTQKQSLIARIIAALFGPRTLKDASKTALATIFETQASIRAEEARLAQLKLDAVTSSEAVLAKLKSDAAAAAEKEAQDETARAAELEKVKETKAAQVAALERKLATLKSQVASDIASVEAELQTERDEAAAEIATAATTEAQIAAAIEALREGANAQAGLNSAE
jgi:hypothetical protein